jgi:hypothetical protein
MSFAKPTKQFRRHLRVASAAEFDARLLQSLDHVNQDPVPVRWTAAPEDLEVQERSVNGRLPSVFLQESACTR